MFSGRRSHVGEIAAEKAKRAEQCRHAQRRRDTQAEGVGICSVGLPAGDIVAVEA